MASKFPHMKAKELIKILQEDPEREVVVSSDSEGNNYSELYSVNMCAYDKSENRVGLEKLTKKLQEQGYSSLDVIYGVKAFVLYP